MLQLCLLNGKHMQAAGYLASVLIGISLGLIGGGGSILTVPVLVYLFGLDALAATTCSLFVVGIASATGSVAYFRQGRIDTRMALFFGLPSVTAVLLTRKYLLPLIPEQLLHTPHVTITRRMLLLLLFAVLMLAAAFRMIRRPSAEVPATAATPVRYPLVFVQGLLTGVVTGLVGAGGGFLIIPALVQLRKMPMKTAVGTSLLIIAVNALAGFAFSLPHTVIPWTLLWRVAGVAIAGILAGSALARQIDGKRLKPAFGWLVLLMGLYILLKETVFS